MQVSILFSYYILNEALNKNIKTSESLASKESFEVASTIFRDYKWNIFATSQTIDKVGNMLSFIQKTKFEAFICEEKTTKGVASFLPETSTAESSNNLARKGIVIVITSEIDKANIPNKKRIISVNPVEFITIYKHVKKITTASPLGQTAFPEAFLFHLLNSELCFETKKL